MTIVAEHATGHRRNTELLLLVVAVAVGMACYAMVGIGTSPTREIPTGMWWYGAGLLGMTGVMHVLIRVYAKYADPVILPIATCLNGIGLAFIHRVDVAKELAGVAKWVPLTPKQQMWAGVGVAFACVVLVAVRDHRILRRYTYISMVAAIVLLLLPLLPDPIGRELNGARIWVGLGPFAFQPAEVTKVALTIFFAGYLVSNRDQLALAGRKILGMRLPRARDLGPLLVVWGVSVGVLVLQRDLGTSLLFFGLFVAMLYVATERGSWVLVAMTLFISGTVLAWSMFPHVQARVNIWLNAFDTKVINAKAGSFQIVQGWYGMAKGGLLGSGLGQGSPTIVPYVHSDFIIAGLGEELGLVGLFAILMLFMVLVERAMRTAIGVRDGFGKLLAAGLGFVFCLQLFVVVGGVTRIIPLTGLTTPFLAHGGSSLVMNWVVVALLLRVSHAARKPAPTGTPRLLSDEQSTQVIEMSPAQLAAAHTTGKTGAMKTGSMKTRKFWPGGKST